MKKDKKMSEGEKVAIGVGVTATALASAGAYYLLGPNKKTHQKKVRMLTAKIEKELNRKIKKAKKLTVPLYHKAVDVIAENYSKQYKMHEKDTKTIAKKLKSEWKGAPKTVKKSVRKIKKNLPSSVI